MDLEPRLAGPDGEDAGLLLDDQDLLPGEGADDLHQLLGLDGDPALALDVRLAPRGEGDVQVGGRQVEPVLAGGEQQVGKDRDGRLALDDALHRGQLAQELATGDTDFHSLFSI